MAEERPAALPPAIRIGAPGDAARLAAAGLRLGCVRNEAHWQVRLAGPPAVVLLAADPAGTIVAVLEAQWAADEGEIVDIVVAPEVRRRGIARALLACLRDELAARGVVRLFLEVAVDNDAALALYRCEGFAPAARRPGYYARPGGVLCDALVMRCDLAGAPASPPSRTIEE